MQINMNFWSIYLRLNQRSWTPSELIKPSGLAIPLTVFTIDLKLITVHSSIWYFVMNKKSVNKSEFINKWGTTNRRMHSISHDYAYRQSLWRPFTFNFLYSDLLRNFQPILVQMWPLCAWKLTKNGLNSTVKKIRSNRCPNGAKKYWWGHFFEIRNFNVPFRNSKTRFLY